MNTIAMVNVDSTCEVRQDSKRGGVRGKGTERSMEGEREGGRKGRRDGQTRVCVCVYARARAHTHTHTAIRLARESSLTRIDLGAKPLSVIGTMTIVDRSPNE